MGNTIAAPILGTFWNILTGHKFLIAPRGCQLTGYLTDLQVVKNIQHSVWKKRRK
jgi:hypothetical protein